MSSAPPKEVDPAFLQLANIRTSFTFSYLLLFGATLITFIEALRTKDAKARNILNLETTVSLIASFVYGQFLVKLDAVKDPFALPGTLREIMQLRYMDWVCTTPLLLLALILFLTYRSKKPAPARWVAVVVLLNLSMLVAGFLGETQRIPLWVGSLAGFAFFLALLAVVWLRFLTTPSREHMVVFGVFAFIWALYGVAYHLEEVKKNMMYNLLDVFAKAMIGLFVWLYFGNILRWE